MTDNTTTKPWTERVRDWFPDREFFMRSDGQVRFIKISSKLQMRVAGSAVALAAVVTASLGVMAWGQYQASSELASFQTDRAQVATAQERLNAYGDDLNSVAEDLKKRQDVLDAMLPMLPEDLRDGEADTGDESGEASELVKKVSSLIPQASGLAEIEARQLAYVERITRYAEWRAQKAEAALRKLNLDPKVLSRGLADDDTGGRGGPLEALATSADGSLDPRFERMGRSLTRMSQLERLLDGVPQVVPAASGRNTSHFGLRRDPITGRAAMHSGLDYGGEIGSPIYAAAAGRIAFAGWKGGYGKTIEIAHGNGMITRYAHLSRFDVKVGDRVEAGETIAGLGNTGRSTGPHLHFEVRINDRPVNPRPFLESAPDVLKEVRGASTVRTRSTKAKS